MRAFLTTAVLSGLLVLGGVLPGLGLLGCNRQEAAAPDASAAKPAARRHTSNIPPLHPTNIVSLAMKSEDHTTLVTAIKAADYVTSVAASGPLTVFAPTNEAFDKLPASTVEALLEPENADDLREILKYHVTTSSLTLDTFKDGQSLSMANGVRATMRVEGDEVTINGAKIIASLPASNGTLHVIDRVLVPPQTN